MPRLRQVPRAEAAPSVLPLYQLLFGDRDPGRRARHRDRDARRLVAGVRARPRRVRPLGRWASRSTRARSGSLDPQLRELGQTRAGFTVASQFVFSQHCKSCRTAGMAEEKIAAIPHWQVADCFSPIERAVLAYTDALTYDQGRVPDGVFEALRAGLSDEEILELTYITAMYAMHAVMSKALRTEFDDRDEPIVEIPAPGDDQTFRT